MLKNFCFKTIIKITSENIAAYYKNMRTFMTLCTSYTNFTSSECVPDMQSSTNVIPVDIIRFSVIHNVLFCSYFMAVSAGFPLGFTPYIHVFITLFLDSIWGGGGGGGGGSKSFSHK